MIFFELLAAIPGLRCEMYMLHAELIQHVMIQVTDFHYWLDNEALIIQNEVLACAMILIDLFFYRNVELFTDGAIEGIGLRTRMNIPMGKVLAVGISLQSDNQATCVSATHGMFGTLYCSNHSGGSASCSAAEFANVYTGCIDYSRLEERLLLGVDTKLYVMSSDNSVSAGTELHWNYHL
jgi:hypothetical protein